MGNKVVLHRLGKSYSHHDLEPSCGVMDIHDEDGKVRYRLVIDAGAVIRRKQGREWLAGPDMTFFEDGILIDAICITHAHQDHVGFLPALMPHMREGAQVFMTRPTSMAVRYSYIFEISPTAPPNLTEKPYGPEQVIETMHRIKIISQQGIWRIVPGIQAWVQSSGHIAGACSFTFNVNGTKIHFAGDRCDHNQPGILGAPTLPPEWHPDIIAQSDCTYGKTAPTGATWESEMDRMAETCETVFREGRRMLIYTFAMHRAGVIAHALQERGVIRSQQPFYMDGSARDYSKMMNGGHSWCPQDSAFEVDKIGMLEGKNSRHAAIDRRDGKFVVIAPPGMGGPGGSGTWWRRRLLTDPKAIIAFTGYVAPDSDGHIIIDAAERRERGEHVNRLRFRELNRYGAWREKEYPFHCQVEQFRIGSHNDQTGTIQWFRDINPKIAILTHGSTEALAEVERQLQDSGIKLIRSDKEQSTTIDL